MSSNDHSDRVSLASAGSKLLAQLVERSLEIQLESEFLTTALELLCNSVGATGATLVQGTKGQWRLLAHWGAGDGLPEELLAETLDSARCGAADGWTGTPLLAGNQQDAFWSSQLIAANTDSVPLETFDACAAAVGLAYQVFRNRHQHQNRATRFEAMLDMTVQWNQSRQTDELLEQIAETSTRLLGAERATIFLPDTSGEQLVGKPATGVEGGQIQIPKNAGVVGQVFNSGKPARVDDDVQSEQQQINRSVCLLYTSPSPRDGLLSRMPSSA